jgi:hypothetical protein
MEMFVIITVQKSRGANASEAVTMSWHLRPGPGVDREGLFRYVVEHALPEEHRGGVVLFYSAEPLQLGGVTPADAAPAVPVSA